MVKKLIRNPMAWIALLVLVFALILAIRPSEAWFGVPGEWTWSGRPPSPSTYMRWSPAIFALLITTLFVVGMDRRWGTLPGTARIAALIILVFSVPIIQILLTHIHFRYPLEAYLHRTIGPFNGFWQEAIHIDSLLDYLRSYPERMRSSRSMYIHLATHPPGTVIYMWIWRKVLEMLPQTAYIFAHYFRSYACADINFVRLSDVQIATALGQITIPFLSGIGIIPLYLWASQLGGKRCGWRAAALFALLPTLSLFTMRWDTLYPFFTASAFAALHRGLESKRLGWWFLSGFIVSCASFFSFGNAILAPAIALYAILYLWIKEKNIFGIIQPLHLWVSLILGGYSVWGLFKATTGVSVWNILDVTGGIQSDLRAAYNYPKWVIYNLGDILSLSGFPITVLFMIEVVRGLKLLTTQRTKIQRLSTAIPALTIAAVIIAIDLSGLSPGEVARLWMHLTTGMIVSAAIWMNQAQNNRSFKWVTLMLAFLGLWLALFLRVAETGLPSYSPRQVTIRDEPDTVMARYDEGFVLSGATVVPNIISRGGVVEVELTWYAERRADTPYTVFVHLLDDQGQIIAQADSMPVMNTLPTTCWIPGETIHDQHLIEIPEYSSEGLYQINIGWYDLVTMQRLNLNSNMPSSDAYILPDVVKIISDAE